MSALLSLVATVVSARMALRLHRESGPLPVLTVYHHTSQDPKSEDRVQAVVVNHGRVACRVTRPFLNQNPNRNGPTISSTQDPVFQGEDSVLLPPGDFTEWWLKAAYLSDPGGTPKVLRVHVDCPAFGSRGLERKTIVNGQGGSHDWLLLHRPW